MNYCQDCRQAIRGGCVCVGVDLFFAKASGTRRLDLTPISQPDAANRKPNPKYHAAVAATAMAAATFYVYWSLS